MIVVAQVSASRFYTEMEPTRCLLTLVLTIADNTKINASSSKKFSLSISVDIKTVLPVRERPECQHKSAASSWRSCSSRLR